MPDVLDEIIDMLPPSTLRLIANFNKDRVQLNELVSDPLQDLQEVKLKQIKSEFERKTYDVKSKTSENRNYLSKLKNELEIINSLKEPDGNQKGLKAYTMKIEELSGKVKNLTGEYGHIDLAQLLNEVEELHHEIEEHKKKIAEAKNLYKCYDNFPPNVEKAREEIANIKERIKQHQLAVKLV